MTSSTAIRTAVVGVGYLGKFHAQKYATLPGSNLIGVVDNNAENAKTIAAEHGVEAYTDHRDLFGQVDAVSIVTPTTLHHRIAKEFLEQGIHVLVEKPITVTPDEARDLIETAKANNCILQVGHLERFNAAMLDLDKVLVQPRFIEAHRLAPYKPRATDVDVILDLMIHDIDIILSTVRSELVSIDVSGTKVLSDATDIANARLTFASGCVANVTASRISLKSERKMRIFQPDAYLSIDFQNRIFSYHTKGEGEMFPGVPDINSTENIYEDGDALQTEIAAFIDCVQNGSAPLVSGEDGLRALEAATRITEMLHQQEQS
ncbi:MAG: Gfo/Idh/MocA family oxidoreductase [Pseudomonadales bacterium]|jgi:predicted dehydrogenase